MEREREAADSERASLAALMTSFVILWSTKKLWKKPVWDVVKDKSVS